MRNQRRGLGPAEKERMMYMEKQRISMPAGALIACILIVAFLLALVAGGIMWAVKSYKNGGRSAYSEEPAVTQAAETAAPADTQQPEATEPAPTESSAPAPIVDIGGHDGSSTVGGEQEDIIAACMDTVVSIDITMSSGYSDVYAGSGSGVIITSDGYIVTCNHVIEGASTIMVYLNDGSEHDAQLIGTDSVTDIAVIKIEGSNYPHAALGSSSALRVGNEVYAIGNALGELSNTVTEGIISGLDREIEIEKQPMVVLQTSAAINSGNSGGALFLNSGELIGIVNAKSSGTTSSGATIEGLAFAVPIDTAKPIINDLVAYGFVLGRPYLGVATQDSSYSTGWFSYATYPVVKNVVAGSPAEIAGIQVNDIITAINGETVGSSTELRAMINSFAIGDTITVTVSRNNMTYNIEVTLAERTSA